MAVLSNASVSVHPATEDAVVSVWSPSSGANANCQDSTTGMAQSSAGANVNRNKSQNISETCLNLCLVHGLLWVSIFLLTSKRKFGKGSF